MDGRRLLTINTGSSSLKAALYRLREDTKETPKLRVEAGRIGGRDGGMRLADDRGETLDERWDDLSDHAAALDALLSRLRDRGLDRGDLAAVGHPAYSREHFEDPPEIRDWTWTPWPADRDPSDRTSRGSGSRRLGGKNDGA